MPTTFAKLRAQKESKPEECWGTYAGETTIVTIWGILKITQMAVLFETDEGDVWVPRSCLNYADVSQEEAHIATWYVEREGLV